MRLKCSYSCKSTYVLCGKLKKKKINGPRTPPGGPVVKNLPHNAGDTGLIPGWATKIPHATEQLSPSTSTTESK